MAIPHFVLLPSTEEPPNFSGYVELRFPTCGRWDLSRNHTCYSTFSFSLLKTMMWLVSSKIEMRAIPLETEGQGCRRNKGPCMTSQSRTTTSGLVITSDYCEREKNIFYISLSGNLYGNQFTIWLIHQANEEIWPCEWVGLQEREEEAVRESMGKQLVCWTPVFCSLVVTLPKTDNRYSRVSCHILQKSMKSPIVSYVWKITMIQLQCYLSFCDISETFTREKQSVWSSLRRGPWANPDLDSPGSHLAG